MKKSLNKTTLATTLVCLLPIIPGFVLYSRLPEQLPIHFDATGAANGFAPKLVAVLGLPIMMAIINLVVNVVMANDPKKANFSKTMYTISRWVIPVISLIAMPATLFAGMGYQLPIHVVVTVLVGGLIIVMGNYLPKCKQNYTMGIKLPWTLNSEENWNKTHHMAGYLWIFSGIIMVAGSFLGSVLWFSVLMIVVPVMVIVPAVYSYMLYKKGI